MTTSLTALTALTARTMETEMLTRRLTRQLYKSLGEPGEDEFPGVHNIITSFARTPGYTTRMRHITPDEMRQKPIEWRVKRPSDIKQRIAHRYYDDGWTVRVSSYIVACDKYIRSTRDTRLAVHLVSTRDKSTYEYCIVDD